MIYTFVENFPFVGYKLPVEIIFPLGSLILNFKPSNGIASVVRPVNDRVSPGRYCDLSVAILRVLFFAITSATITSPTEKLV